MNVLFLPNGWEDYEHWRTNDRKMQARVATLINDVRRSPFAGLGKPEPLRKNLAGWWSRRITEEHRLVYRITGSGDAQRIEIAQCRYHYGR